MKTKHLLIVLTVTFFCAIFLQQAYPQGVTTAAMSGVVVDKGNNPLPAANVIAVHIPSGTQYGASTRSSGQFNIPNMKIGGPYTVTVSFVGYSKDERKDIFLNLGQQLRLDFTLAEEAVIGEEVLITADKFLTATEPAPKHLSNPRKLLFYLPSKEAQEI